MFALLLLFVSVSEAQVITKKEIEEYTNIGSNSWHSRAAELEKIHPLNDNGALVMSCVKEYPNQTKETLYNKIFEWILSFSHDKTALLVSDRDAGQIQVRCFMPDIAKRTMGDNSYRVSIRPLLKFEFKEGKVRFTFTLQDYTILKRTDDSGYVFMFGNDFGITGGGSKTDGQIWLLQDCYPFTRNWKHPKVTSSRAFVNSISCYNILTDRISAVLQASLSTENDDW